MEGCNFSAQYIISVNFTILKMTLLTFRSLFLIIKPRFLIHLTGSIIMLHCCHFWLQDKKAQFDHFIITSLASMNS